MKTTHIVAILITLSSLSGFARQQEIVIKCTIGKGKGAITLGPSKSPMKASTTKEIYFATEWDLPRKIKNDEGFVTYQPLTPLTFERTTVGWEVSCRATNLGNLIQVTGTASFSEPELTQAVFGEQSGPIYSPKNILLTQNISKTVSIHSSSSPFQLFVIPGKEYTFKIRKLNKWVSCKIACDYITK